MASDSEEQQPAENETTVEENNEHETPTNLSGRETPAIVGAQGSSPFDIYDTRNWDSHENKSRYILSEKGPTILCFKRIILAYIFRTLTTLSLMILHKKMHEGAISHDC